MISEQTRWHSLSLGEIFSQVGTKKDGLTTPEALRRLERQGPNTLQTLEGKSWWKLYLREIVQPLMLLLIAAGTATALVGSYKDSIVIFIVAFANSFIGFFQASKAEKAVRSLTQHEQEYATVKRDGTWRKMKSSEVVPGDIILIKSGDKIPADARLIAVEETCTVEEALLTGESEAQVKNIATLPNETHLSERYNMVWKGTVLVEGKGHAVVVATGMSSVIGEIGSETQKAEETKTPFELRVSKLTRLLGVLVIASVIALFVLGVLTGRGVEEMFLIAVAVTVSTIPEGLPIVLTAILSVGVVRIARAGGLVKSLASAQSLGSTSVILTDKTGTLTEGKMSVEKIISYVRKGGSLRPTAEEEVSNESILEIAALTTDVVIEHSHNEIGEWVVHASPTEKAIVYAAAEAGIFAYEREDISERVRFSSKRAFSAVSRKEAGRYVAYALGSPELLLERATHILVKSRPALLSTEDKKDILAFISEQASYGLRILGVCYKTYSSGQLDALLKQGLTLCGFIGLKDAVRKDATEAFLETQRAGIRTVIVTGDHARTALSVAGEIGMQKKGERSFVVMEGDEAALLTDDDLARRVRNVDVFARVSPDQKLKIVRAWQSHGAVVATFGDGVNDAPALKQADVGVVVGSGTDLAKEASDIVLQKNSFSTIVAAVKEGRVIIDNLKKALTYILSDSFTELLLLTVAILARLPLPILPAQILWAKIVADIGPGISLAFETPEKDVMARQPMGKESSLIDKEMRFIIIVVGFLTDAILVGLFLFFLAQHMPIEKIRTIIFAALALETVFYAFSMRSLRKPLWKVPLISNKYLVSACGAGILLTVVAVYFPPLTSLLRTEPLSLLEWIIIAGFGIVNVIAIETAKWLFWSRRAHQ